jgi:hypothetical protein
LAALVQVSPALSMSQVRHLLAELKKEGVACVVAMTRQRGGTRSEQGDAG